MLTMKIGISGPTRTWIRGVLMKPSPTPPFSPPSPPVLPRPPLVLPMPPFHAPYTLGL